MKAGIARIVAMAGIAGLAVMLGGATARAQAEFGPPELIAAAKAHAPQARFVMASIGLVYDADASHPGLEDDVTHPKLAYPASKIAAENELRNSGLNWSILRLGFVYGNGDEHLASVTADRREVGDPEVGEVMLRG